MLYHKSGAGRVVCCLVLSLQGCSSTSAPKSTKSTGGSLSIGGTSAIGGQATGTANTSTASGIGGSGSTQTGGTSNASGGMLWSGGVSNFAGGTEALNSQGGVASGGGAAELDAGADAATNVPPIPVLWYELTKNKWYPVNAGDTVTRPVNEYINWSVCDSYDPDGTVTEIWLYDGVLTQLKGPQLDCILEYIETFLTPVVNQPSYVLVIDNQGAQSTLDFTYQTQ